MIWWNVHPHSGRRRSRHLYHFVSTLLVVYTLGARRSRVDLLPVVLYSPYSPKSAARGKAGHSLEGAALHGPPNRLGETMRCAGRCAEMARCQAIFVIARQA